MKELIEAAISWQTLLGAIVVFSLIPGVVLHLMVRIYPHDHPRRRELIADYAVVPRWERPFWVTEHFVTVTFEGIPVRRRALRERRAGRGRENELRLIRGRDGQLYPGKRAEPLVLGNGKTITVTIVDSVHVRDQIGP